MGRSASGLALLALALWCALAPAAPAAAQGAPTAPPPPGARVFPETGHWLAGAFLRAWEAGGGLARFGYPISPPLADDGGRTIQWTERARLEYHPALLAGERVLLGLLGREATAGRASEPAFAPVADSGRAGARYFEPTGHTLAAPFRARWEAGGGLAAFGYPISEPFAERNPDDGQDYTVQYFERARLEHHPAPAGAAAEVQLGLLGRQLYLGGGAVAPTVPDDAATPPALPPPGAGPLRRPSGRLIDGAGRRRPASAGVRGPRRRRQRPALRRRAGRAHPHRAGRRVLAEPFLDIADLVDVGAAPSRACSARLPPRLRRQRHASTSTTPTAPATATTPSPATASRPTIRTAADPASERRSCSPSPSPSATTTAAARLRAGRLPLRRPRRRRRRRRPSGNGQNRAHAPRQDPAPRRRHGGDAVRHPARQPVRRTGDGARPEIWAYGLRNPWRFSFDRATGDLYIADVGQSGARRSTSSRPAAPAARTTAGTSWRARPASSRGGLRADRADAARGRVRATSSAARSPAATSTAGEAVPALRGVYLFADLLHRARLGPGARRGGRWGLPDAVETGLNISSFGEDAAGELYVTDLAGGTSPA